MKAEPITNYVFTPHLLFEMERRGLTEEIVRAVLSEPAQRLEVRSGRVVLQSQIPFQDKMYLVRVFVDIDRKPAEVVTAYRTSKVEKYWRENE